LLGSLLEQRREPVEGPEADGVNQQVDVSGIALVVEEVVEGSAETVCIVEDVRAVSLDESAQLRR
jgi:hypothetical protein